MNIDGPRHHYGSPTSWLTPEQKDRKELREKLSAAQTTVDRGNLNEAEALIWEAWAKLKRMQSNIC